MKSWRAEVWTSYWYPLDMLLPVFLLFPLGSMILMEISEMQLHMYL